MSQSYVAYSGPRGPLQHHCDLCKTTGPDLLQCTDCHIVRYCSREHQVQHHQQHKYFCESIGERRATFQREDYVIRNDPVNVFETLSGYFLHNRHTRLYIIAHFNVAIGAQTADTLDGFTEALEHFQAIVRLGRAEPSGFSGHVPALLMRLGRDQECYDFINWCAKTRDTSYERENINLQFLDVKDTDVLALDTLRTIINHINIESLAIVLLLNFKLLIDIRNIKVARKVLKGRLPVELCLEVEGHVIQSPLSLRLTGQSYSDLSNTETGLLTHCHLIKCKISEVHPYFMAELADPRGKTFKHHGEPFSRGAERLLADFSGALRSAYPAWWETPNALELLRAAFHAVHDNSDDILHEYLGPQETRLVSMPQVHNHNQTDPAPHDPDAFEPFETMLNKIVTESSNLSPRLAIEPNK